MQQPEISIHPLIGRLQINVSNLTFGYEGSYDTIFENVSFSIDTSWKLGFVGRNGKGKTTFLQLLLGKYEYQGAITRSVVFDYFPYPVKQKDLERTAAELMEDWKAGVESWRVLCELEKLDMDAELLYRPFGTLSFGDVRYAANCGSHARCGRRMRAGRSRSPQ